MADNPFESSPGFSQPADAWSESKKPRGGFGCLKGCLIGCGVLVALAAIAGFVIYRNTSVEVNKDPVAARALLKDLLGAEPPAGYDTPFGLNATFFKFGFKMVAVAPAGVEADGQEELDNTKSTFFIIMSVPGATAENMRFQAKDIGNIKEGKNVEQKVVEVSVGGKKVDALRIVSEQDDNKVLQYFVYLKGGTFMVAAGPEEKFDQKSFESFLESIKTDGPE